MIRLAGHKPCISQGAKRDGTPSVEEIEIVFSGLKLGEKSYEELLIGANLTSSTHPRIQRTQEQMLKFGKVTTVLGKLKFAWKEGIHII